EEEGRLGGRHGGVPGRPSLRVPDPRPAHRLRALRRPRGGAEITGRPASDWPAPLGEEWFLRPNGAGFNSLVASTPGARPSCNLPRPRPSPFCGPCRLIRQRVYYPGSVGPSFNPASVMAYPLVLLKFLAKGALNAVSGGVGGDFLCEVLPDVAASVWGWWHKE